MSLTLEFMAVLAGIIFVSLLFSGFFVSVNKKIDFEELKDRKNMLVASAYCNLFYFNVENIRMDKKISFPKVDVSGNCFGNGTLNVSDRFNFGFYVKRWFP